MLDISQTKILQIPGASEKLNSCLKEIYNDFAVSDEKIDQIIKRFHVEMQDGLERDNGLLPMLPSYVTVRPTGKEKGTYLSLDLGGTNLRVCLVTLNGDSTFSIVQQKYTITNEAKADNLFDWIANCVDLFIIENKLVPDAGTTMIPCGFTFSFPIVQSAINRGTLVMWNKGFSVPNVVGRDVAVMTQNAFMRKHLNVKIVAIVNDTIGTLMASGYANPDSQMGIIFGTGTNACYWEKREKILKWNPTEDIAPFDEMILNMEWGAFDVASTTLPYTPHDNKLNRKSINHGLQVFEKMISGLYLGEVIRNALLWLVDRRVLFNGRSSDILNDSYKLDTAYVSSIVADETPNLDDVKLILEVTLSIPDTTLQDRQIVQEVCKIIGLRANRLSAAALCAVLLWRPELLDKEMTIGIDGSMYEFFPGFDKGLIKEMTRILGEERAKNVKLVLAKDGSGVGAAIVAMIASKDLE
ncbi:Hexokinase-1 [Smittium mucronatum]|uniref:Phosphotransferase n=1 Tax=Smittium mucronatum TaxID=133383 RepID=A0A1R0H3G1_9FUNG|nr:Hexokinase-1 [Smittium mucronatum]